MMGISLEIYILNYMYHNITGSQALLQLRVQKARLRGTYKQIDYLNITDIHTCSMNCMRELTLPPLVSSFIREKYTSM